MDKFDLDTILESNTDTPEHNSGTKTPETPENIDGKLQSQRNGAKVDTPKKIEIDQATYNDAIARLKKSFNEAFEMLGNCTIVAESSSDDEPLFWEKNDPDNNESAYLKEKKEKSEESDDDCEEKCKEKKKCKDKKDKDDDIEESVNNDDDDLMDAEI